MSTHLSSEAEERQRYHISDQVEAERATEPFRKGRASLARDG